MIPIIDGFQDSSALTTPEGSPPSSSLSSAISPISGSSASSFSSLKRTVSSLQDLSKWADPFLVRLAPQERQAAEKAMRSITGIDIHLVLSGDWTNLSRETISAAILKAHLEGQIDEMEAARHFLHLRCLTSNKTTQVHSIHINEGWDLLTKALPNWDTVALQKLQNSLQLEDLEEGEFFSFSTTKSLLVKDGVLDVGSYATGFLPFSVGFIDEGEQIHNLIIPPKLWQKLLDGEFGKQAIRVKPILGYSVKEKFSDYSERVVSIPCDFITSLPEKVHNIVDGKDNCAMYQHDALYHAYIESANPHRAIWTEIALATKQIHKELGISLLDRNCPQYVTCGKNKEKAFWDALSENLNLWFSSHSTEKEKTFIDQFIASKACEWNQKYGVDLSRRPISRASSCSPLMSDEEKDDEELPVFTKPRLSVEIPEEKESDFDVLRPVVKTETFLQRVGKLVFGLLCQRPSKPRAVFTFPEYLYRSS